MPVSDEARMDAIHENRILSGWTERLPRTSGQIGGVHETDAELMPLGDGRLLALTVDAVVEELASGLYTLRDAGRVAVAACLSDLAAVGAEPLGVLLSVTLPEPGAEEVQRAVAAGARAACDAAGTAVLGGDTASGAVVSVTAVGAGTVPAATVLLRRGCVPGDHVFATGPLGLGSVVAAGRLLGLEAAPEVRPAPVPRTAAGMALRGRASACMDTSDGLLATLDQVTRLNGVAVQVTGTVEGMLHPVARRLARDAGLPPLAFLAGQHGEFELVFTLPDERLPDLDGIAARGSFTPVAVGRVQAGVGVWLNARQLDTTRIRNLAHEHAPDPRAYAAALLEAIAP